ncbi:MAG: ABC transporter permease, partial [Planctomycetaceae bacterium]|nr:ABC transporter permease [Planctomycetaceae bacterium]
MNELTREETKAAVTVTHVIKSPGFWKESWTRFKKRKMSMLALAFVLFLTIVAIFSPAIVGTKPVICKYKGNIYFPCMGYFNFSWENPIFLKDKFRQVYPKNLKKNDPDSWAIWPLVYQDPERRVKAGEFEGIEANPTQDDGVPSKQNIFGTDRRGFDVFAQMVHGTRIALLVGFVSMGIATIIGIAVGALGGFCGGWIDIILSRITEVVMCIPTLVLILALIAIVENRTIYHLMAVIGLTGWTGIARLTRAEFLKLKQMDFVAAAQVLGISRTRIIFRHILPNSLAP